MLEIIKLIGNFCQGVIGKLFDTMLSFGEVDVSFGALLLAFFTCCIFISVFWRGGKV